ncbi:MAG: hypothetical protein JWM19_7971, partial [Actinomycetia bacterium]|nr:hypothetical protein [Actinomycetes bacterium]
PTIDMFWDLVLRYAPFGMVCCHLVDAAHNRADLLATNTSTGDGQPKANASATDPSPSPWWILRREA